MENRNQASEIPTQQIAGMTAFLTLQINKK